MDTKPNTIVYGLDAVRQASLNLYARRGADDLDLFAHQHRHLAFGQNRQVAKVVRVLQDGYASRDFHLLGVQTVAEVVCDHETLFHIYTVMYG